MAIESYHLRLNHQHEAINILKELNINGFIHPKENGWITIVINGKELTINEPLINHYKEHLLYFINAEDNGCVFTLFNDHKVFSHYSVLLDKDIIINTDLLNINGLYTFLKDINDDYDTKILLQQFESIDKYDLYHETIAEKVANIFKIQNFNLSYEQLLEKEENDDLAQDIIHYKK